MLFSWGLKNIFHTITRLRYTYNKLYRDYFNKTNKFSLNKKPLVFSFNYLRKYYSNLLG